MANATTREMTAAQSKLLSTKHSKFLKKWSKELSVKAGAVKSDCIILGSAKANDDQHQLVFGQRRTDLPNQSDLKDVVDFFDDRPAYQSSDLLTFALRVSSLEKMEAQGLAENGKVKLGSSVPFDIIKQYSDRPFYDGQEPVTDGQEDSGNVMAFTSDKGEPKLLYQNEIMVPASKRAEHQGIALRKAASLVNKDDFDASVIEYYSTTQID